MDARILIIVDSLFSQIKLEMDIVDDCGSEEHIDFPDDDIITEDYVRFDGEPAQLQEYFH